MWYFFYPVFSFNVICRYSSYVHRLGVVVVVGGVHYQMALKTSFIVSIDQVNAINFGCFFSLSVWFSFIFIYLINAKKMVRYVWAAYRYESMFAIYTGQSESFEVLVNDKRVGYQNLFVYESLDFSWFVWNDNLMFCSIEKLIGNFFWPKNVRVDNDSCLFSSDLMWTKNIDWGCSTFELNQPRSQ